MKHKVAALVVVAILVVGAGAWRNDKLNKWLPERLRHRKDNFIGLTRSGQYFTAPGGGPGMTYYEGRKGDFFLTEFRPAADGKPLKLAAATDSYSKNAFGANPATAAMAKPDSSARRQRPGRGARCWGRDGCIRFTSGRE